MNVFRSKSFNKSLKKFVLSQKVRVQEVEKVIELLLRKEKMPAKYKDHALKGEWKGYRECHIRPDVLLIYKIEHKELVLVLVDIGTHASLFK